MAASDSFELFSNATLPFLRRIEEVFAIIGIVYVGKVTLSTLFDILVGFRAHVYSRLWKSNFVNKYGKWAVITGCTDGIGKCYAEELAKDGMNIILVSRNMDKLNRVSNELKSKYKIETEIVQADFSDGRKIYEKIATHLEGKEIGMLVNNVGIMCEYPKPFAQITENEIWAHVNVNMASVCAMTKLVMPQMIARARGAIVNIASIAGAGAIPYMSIYAASKVFVDSVSRAMEWEYRSKGLTMQTVTPSYVATNMTSFSPWVGTTTPLTPSASVFARHAVKTIGYTDRTSGYWLHGIQSWFVEKIMSRWAFTSVMGYLQQFLARGVKKSP